MKKKKTAIRIAAAIAAATIISGATGLTEAKASATVSATKTTTTGNATRNQYGTNSIQAGDFSVMFRFGLSGNARQGAAFPITMDITSQKDFEGTVRIIIPSGSDYYEEDSSFAYEQGITLSSGSQKTIYQSVKNSGGATYCTFQIEDANGKLLVNTPVTMNTTSTEYALVGILSNDYTALNYMDHVYLNTLDYSGNTSILEMASSTFPTGRDSIDALSYLVINSYDTSSLTAAQQENILSWVKDGGFLILGGGSDYKQTLSMFGSDILELQTDGYRTGTLDAVGKEVDPLPYDETAGILDMKLTNGTALDGVTNDENTVWVTGYGAGRIAVTSFNLGMEPLASWKFRSALAERIFNQMAADGYSRQLSKVNYGNSDSYFYDNNIQGLYSEKAFSTGLIAGVLLLYLISLPIGYVILRRKSKQMLFWIAAPASAVLFTAVLFTATTSVRMRKPVTGSVTILSAADAATASEVYMSVLTPRTSWYSLKFDPSLSDIRISESYDYNYYGILSSEKSDYTYALREDTDGYQIRMRKNSAFDNTTLAMSGRGSDLGAGLVTDLSRTLTGVSGTFTNNTDHVLRNVTYASADMMLKAGDLQPGECKSLTEADVIHSSYLYESFFEYEGDMSEEEALSMYIAYSVLYDNYISNLEYSNSDKGYTLAYAEGFEADYVQTAGVEENNVAVLVKEEVLAYSDYNNAHAYQLFDYASNDDGAWDKNDGQMYSLEAETSINLQGLVDEIYVLKKYGANSGSYYYGETENTKVFIWNYETSDWEQLFADSDLEDFTGSRSAKPYIEDGRMKMKFVCQTEYDDFAPHITLIGGMN